MMHGHEKSRSAIVAVKPTNKAERSAAESVERRAETKGNVDQQRTRRTQRRISVSQMLARIRQHIVAVDTQGGNRMRESCTYGSVRGVRGNSRPYRNRRDVLSLLGGAALSRTAGIAQADARARIGVLTLSSPKDEDRIIAAFVEGLHKHGYIEAKNVDLDYRYAEGDVSRLVPLAQELVALKPNVVLGGEGSPTRAFKRVAPTLPIVCPVLTDALLPELAASYARPGGSVTGIAQTVEGVAGKLLELAEEFVPGALRVGFLSNPSGASMQFFANS